MHLSHFQNAFAAALFQDGTDHIESDPTAIQAINTLQAQPGFAVYRNTVLKGCIDALQANYPTVSQLVGDSWFRAAAAVYAHAHPPPSGLLMDYGESLETFLAQFEPAATLPYLPAVARLDRCWTECHLALDAPSLDTHWLTRQHPANLPTLELQPHPAARWAWSDTHPAYALWANHRNGAMAHDDLPWVGDGGLLTRPQDAVTWRAISPAGIAFLDACANGMALEGAATAALTAEPAVDFAALMTQLLNAGALSERHPGNCMSTGPNDPIQPTGAPS